MPKHKFWVVLIGMVAAVCVIGILSNFLSAADVENRVLRDCESSIERVTGHWRLPRATVQHLPESSVRIRASVTDGGERVTYQVPPTERPPFCYAHSRQAAPFILRVRYGWAAAGPRMQFGQGGEQVVLSVFGMTRKISNHIEWAF